MDTREQDEGTVECPACGGTGGVEMVDEDGASREVECPLCEGSGKVSMRRLRHAREGLPKWFRPREFPRLGPPFGRHKGGGGRFRRPGSILLPLTVNPWAGGDDEIVVEQRANVPGTGTAAARDPKETEERPVRDHADSGVPGEGLEEVVLEEQVTCDFSVADSQVEVGQPEPPELIAGESGEPTLEATHEGTLGDLDYRIEPYPMQPFEEVDYDPLGYDPLDPGTDLGETPPPGGMGGAV